MKILGAASMLATTRIFITRRRESIDWLVVIASIREFNRTVPFVPHEIHTASGESYEVTHPDFISISPKGSFVFVIDAKERPHHLNALLIDRASPLNGQKRERARRRS